MSEPEKTYDLFVFLSTDVVRAATEMVEAIGYLKGIRQGNVPHVHEPYQMDDLRAAIARASRSLAAYDALTGHNVEMATRAQFESSYDGGDDHDDDPAGTNLLKPRGNGGVVNAEICFSALLLMGDVDISEETMACWSPDNLAVAYDWAMRRHLQASDNDDVIVPPRPSFIPRMTQNAFA